MADALDTVLEKVSKLPPEQRQELAELIEDYVSDVSRASQRMTHEECELVQEGLVEADRGEFATDDAVREIYDRYIKR
jgi:predicted transcriptional regulator